MKQTSLKVGQDGIEDSGIVFMAQFEKDRDLCTLGERCFAIRDMEIYLRVCSVNHTSCGNFLENNPVSKEDYMKGNYAIEFRSDGELVVLSGGAV